jgi:hypothetical protein
LNFLMFCPILMQFLFFGKMIIFMCYWGFIKIVVLFRKWI